MTVCSVDTSFSGPFIVSVGGWKADADPGCAGAQGTMLFQVQISGCAGGRTVFRRYRDFATLDREVRKSRRHLPALPARSFLELLPEASRSCGCLAPGFMERRRQGLSTFVAAVVAADPHCVNTPALRLFLGLPKLPTLSDLFMDDDSDSTFDDSESTFVTTAPSYFEDRKLHPIVETGLSDVYDSVAFASVHCSTVAADVEG